MDVAQDEQHGVVIVGGGQGGSEVAARLRQRGFSGRIRIIGDEHYLPYQRPPLSKDFLSGEIADVSALYLRPPATYESARIELELGVPVERIDPQARRVHLADSRVVPYWRLVLATGGRARQLTGPNLLPQRRLGNLHYVRNIADVLRLRPQLVSGLRLAIVGGGYIGLEIAAVAVKRGLKVTVLESMPRLLARVTGSDIAAFYARVHEAAGVRIHTGVSVQDFELDGSADAVRALNCHGSEGAFRVAADLAVVGIGLVPNAELAAAAELTIDGGILVDAFTRTSDPFILAVGDCTTQDNPVLGGRVRLESVPNAIEQARVAAAALLGRPEAYSAVPWFWSDQYQLKLQSAGLSRGYDRSVVRGSVDDHSFAVLYFRGSTLLAADAVNRPADFAAARRLIGTCMTRDPAVLQDCRRPIAELLQAG